MNTKKKVIHHTTGSHDYARKEETWQEQEEKQSNWVLHL
jgi:hypothetical protein